MPADPRLKDLLRPILPLVVAAVRAKVRTPVATFSDTPKKLGCVYLPLTGDARQMVIDAQKRIDPADLAGDGLEKEPHVTVRYGLHTNDPAEVATTMAPHGPATASLLPELRSFPGDDHDVLYVAVGYPRSGPSVATQNWRLESLPHTDTHSKYIPHATVSYLKPGTASKYVGDLDGNGTTERGDTVVYSAPDGQKHTIRIEQTSPSADFADAPPTDYARYFAADQHGRYPGELHREFGLGVRQFADHTGLVRKQVRYKLNGQTHERYQWVKPPDAPAAPKQPAPTTTPTAPTTSEKQPGKLSTFASKLAKSPGGRVLIKMGGPAVRLALKVEHKLAVVQAKTQQVAVEAARQRGFSPEQADRLEKLLRLGDFLGGYAAAGAGGAVAGGVGAKVGAMMPTASVAYLMYSTARDPGATWRAAKTVMRRTLGLEKATATHADDTSLEGLAGLLADRLAAADDPDWYAAMVYAGLGLTGDLGRAIDAADGEEVPEDGQRFSDDVETFAGRPGLVQKKIQYTRGGKSYTRMQWVKPPAAPKEKPAKPAKKAKPDAPSKPDPKQVKADAHARVKELLAAETPGPDHAKELHAALSRLTVPEIQALKKERDVKGGKTKADHIAKLLAHVQAVRGKVKSVAGLPGVIQEYQSATGRAKQALENALANANVIDPDKPKRKPKDVPPRDLAIALTSSWLELHRLGNKPDEMAPLERALAHAGLERIGEQGSTESFDGTRHDPGKTATLKGAPVKVIRPGWQMKEPGGTLRLVPAAVEPVTSGAKKPKAASPSPPPTPPTRDTIQEKIKAAKHDPDKQAQIVAGIIRATATDGGFVYTHGMSSPTITKKAVIDGVSFHWEDTPDGITRAARTIVNASAFPQPAKLWEATGRVICTSQRNKDDAHWEKEYGTQGFKASATGGDGTTVVYNNGSGSPSLLAHEAGHNLANKLWGQPSPPEDSEYAKAQKVEPPASEYGANSAAEDFAEAVMKYVTTPLTMEQDFPVKFAAVKKLLEGT